MSIVVELGRTFSGAKAIESRALNLLGVQVFRACAARAIYATRRSPTVDPPDSQPVRTLIAEGMVMIPGFLPEAKFERLRAEADGVYSDASLFKVHQHGPTQVRHASLAGLRATEFPELHGWRQNERCLALLSAAEKRVIQPGDGLRVLEQVVYAHGELPDPETSLHVDTFFNTHKLWLYLDDVRVEHGPLRYVPRSHRLSAPRLRRDYAEARAANEGSRRIDEVEIEARGLRQELVTCPANTLLIVNTCGYHSRTVGMPGKRRRALHMSVRFNPFMPVWLNADARLTRRNPRLARMLQAIERSDA